MTECNIGGVRVRISPLFPALMVILLSWEQSASVGRCLAAAFWHECGHIIAMCVCHCRPRAITIGMFGIRMEQDEEQTLSYQQNIGVSIAGPCMNALAAICLWMWGETELSVIHTTLMVFNLLPLSMLDGGQVLYSIFALHMDTTRAAKYVQTISYVLLFFLYTAGIYLLCISKYNISLLITAVYLTLFIFFGGND